MRRSAFVVTFLMLFALAWQWYQGGRFMDLWLSPDQQGQIAYNALEFPRAADLFQDTAWAGTAGYAAGQYDVAAGNFARTGDAVGAFNRGNALMKARKYAEAVDSYDLALAMQPDWREAEENLRLSRYVVDYVERIREQSDTGDESELSADGYVFDNRKHKGQQMTIHNESILDGASSEKWMRTVNTDTREFLSQRFLLEVQP